VAAYREALRACLERWDLPAVASLRPQDLFANAHRRYAGDIGLVLRCADLSWWWRHLPDLVRPHMRLVRIHPDPSAIGTHFAADQANRTLR